MRQRDELEAVAMNPDLPIEARSHASEMLRQIDVALNGEQEGPAKTGDPLIDRWEEQIARGEDPDLTEGMAPEDIPRG